MAKKRQKNSIEYKEILKTISRNIKFQRKEVLGLTQEDMMEFGFDKRYFQKLESGVYGPSLQTLVRVAQTFDISVADLLQTKSSTRRSS